jgi:hypothetical protein
MCAGFSANRSLFTSKKTTGAEPPGRQGMTIGNIRVPQRECEAKKLQRMSFVVKPVDAVNFGLNGIRPGTFIGFAYQKWFPPMSL